MYNYNIFDNRDKLNERIETENHLINKNNNHKMIILVIYLYSLKGKYPKL